MSIVFITQIAPKQHSAAQIIPVYILAFVCMDKKCKKTFVIMDLNALQDVVFSKYVHILYNVTPIVQQIVNVLLNNFWVVAVRVIARKTLFVKVIKLLVIIVIKIVNVSPKIVI